MLLSHAFLDWMLIGLSMLECSPGSVGKVWGASKMPGASPVGVSVFSDWGCGASHWCAYLTSCPTLFEKQCTFWPGVARTLPGPHAIGGHKPLLGKSKVVTALAAVVQWASCWAHRLPCFSSKCGTTRCLGPSISLWVTMNLVCLLPDHSCRAG